jgi:dienelactone hydrolase
MKKIVLIFLFVGHGCATFTQQAYHFTKGLAAAVSSNYGRQAIYTDPLAYQLYSNELQTPIEGGIFGNNKERQSIKWQSITADSLNRLRAPGGFGRGGFGGSYIYLTYSSLKEQNAILHIKGNSSLFFNGEPHTGDPYSSGWLYIPVRLKKGLNELYVRGQNIIAEILFPKKSVFLDTEDATLPFVLPGNKNDSLLGAVVLINSTSKSLTGLKLKTVFSNNELLTSLPSIPPMSSRKVIFGINAEGMSQKGQYDCLLQVLDKEKLIDEKKVLLDVVSGTDKYSNTFISTIDGSLQYYAVTPQSPQQADSGAALFLSVHGAGVEAIGQARAYQSKDWGTLVAATNRRPRGFNWEDWGRMDALEVLAIAKSKFKPDPQQIYLTGHSMGGHGTWFLGATYPDKWAAIAPCAGYPTLKEYGSADGIIPAASSSPMEKMLIRTSNQSDVLKLVSNYKPLGVYIFHGDADRVVPVRYARQMRNILGDFHPDLSYYEYPGGEHWFGDQSVDWKPLFDFFKWHKRLPDSSINNLDFVTANPGISANYRWASVQQQVHPLEYSRVILNRNKKANSITGTTENILLLKLDLSDFGNNAAVKITLDSLNTIQYTTQTHSDSIYLKKENIQWTIVGKPNLFEKGPHRYGTFKDPFQNRMVFVYGTRGNKLENEWSFNKARYDAETWYYRGNGAVDVIADTEYSVSKYDGRNIIIYGNSNTNTVYNMLLKECPIQVQRNRVTIGHQVWNGDDLGAYFIWPIKESASTSVGVIAGTGLKGMNATNANQYFAGGSGFPDFMIFQLEMLKSGVDEIKLAGFFDNGWKLDRNEIVEIK